MIATCFTVSPEILWLLSRRLPHFCFSSAPGFAPWLAPHNPFDPASLDLMEASTPPVWIEDGMSKFLLGTDDQGRDILSTIMFGSRVSLIVGFSAVIFSVIVGVTAGLFAGYMGGWTDAIIMRLADVQLAIPANFDCLND